MIILINPYQVIDKPNLNKTYSFMPFLLSDSFKLFFFIFVKIDTNKPCFTFRWLLDDP